MRFLKFLLLALGAFVLMGCGGGGGPSAQDVAVGTFRAYASDPATAPAPDADDYDTLGVVLNGHTIEEINAYIAQLGDPDATDTKAELDAIAAALGVTILDTDGDGTYDAFDTDDDGDGILDSADAFPLNATESVDTDGDGIGNNSDTDDDDGTSDTEEVTNGTNPLVNEPPTASGYTVILDVNKSTIVSDWLTDAPYSWIGAITLC